MPCTSSKLKDLALKVSYKHLFCLLIQCKTCTPAEMVALQVAIRKWLTIGLDDHLFPDKSTGDKMRAKLVKQFYKDVGEEKLFKDNFPEISTFLDCVLNSSFKELDIQVKLPERSEPDYQLIPAIARRCPKLESLSLEFDSPTQCKTYPEWDEAMPVIWSLSSLTHLSDLHLYFAQEDLISLLKIIGTCCPNLSRLSIDSLVLAKKSHVIALILGKLVVDCHLKWKQEEWGSDAVLQSLLVPLDCVTPYCSTLKHVNLGSYCSPASMAFVLRHLPLLETVDSARGNLSKAVLIYRDAPSLEGTLIQSQFDELCRQAARFRPLNYPVCSPSQRPSPGVLSLTKMEFVSLLEPDVMEAVGSICPALKEVHFGDKPSISPEQLESILSKWPKLERYTVCKGVGPEYVKIIAKVFGQELE